MKKGNLYRIYPDKEQKQLMERHFGSCRFIYNKFLELRSTMYSKFNISLTRTYLDNHLLVLKEIYPWLKDVNSQSLQHANKNLDMAYQRFFNKQGDYPARKSKKDTNSFQVTQRYKINITTSRIYIPNIGWMKIKMHRDLFSTDMIQTTVNNEVIIEKDLNADFLRTATVSRTPTRKYHVSILTEDNIPYPPIQSYSKATTVGVDVGIKTFCALSTGETIDNPKFLKVSLKRLKCLQRRVSRKVKGSNNRKKEVKKLALIYELVVNQRNDFQHNVSLKLIRENQAVSIETLNIKGMIKNHKLAQAISDSAWYGFVSKLMYKAEKLGKTVLKIGMWEPSSKNCSVCGYHNKDLTLDIREWQCPECKTNHDRDINAAINIKKFALMGHEEGPGDLRGLLRGMNQEAPTR
jgi:putative transposase